jgi:hypothetical protein
MMGKVASLIEKTLTAVVLPMHSMVSLPSSLPSSSSSQQWGALEFTK